MKDYTEGKTDIFKFVDKWMDLEDIILSEVTQIQKDKYNMHSFITDFRYKAKTNQGKIYNPREPKQQ